MWACSAEASETCSVLELEHLILFLYMEPRLIVEQDAIQQYKVLGGDLPTMMLDHQQCKWCRASLAYFLIWQGSGQYHSPGPLSATIVPLGFKIAKARERERALNSLGNSRIIESYFVPRSNPFDCCMTLLFLLQSIMRLEWYAFCQYDFTQALLLGWTASLTSCCNCQT